MTLTTPQPAPASFQPLILQNNHPSIFSIHQEVLLNDQESKRVHELVTPSNGFTYSTNLEKIINDTTIFVPLIFSGFHLLDFLNTLSFAIDSYLQIPVEHLALCGDALDYILRGENRKSSSLKLNMYLKGCPVKERLERIFFGELEKKANIYCYNSPKDQECHYHQTSNSPASSQFAFSISYISITEGRFSPFQFPGGLIFQEETPHCFTYKLPFSTAYWKSSIEFSFIFNPLPQENSLEISIYRGEQTPSFRCGNRENTNLALQRYQRKEFSIDIPELPSLAPLFDFVRKLSKGESPTSSQIEVRAFQSCMSLPVEKFKEGLKQFLQLYYKNAPLYQLVLLLNLKTVIRNSSGPNPYQDHLVALNQILSESLLPLNQFMHDQQCLLQNICQNFLFLNFVDNQISKEDPFHLRTKSYVKITSSNQDDFQHALFLRITDPGASFINLLTSIQHPMCTKILSSLSRLVPDFPLKTSISDYFKALIYRYLDMCSPFENPAHALLHAATNSKSTFETFSSLLLDLLIKEQAPAALLSIAERIWHAVNPSAEASERLLQTSFRSLAREKMIQQNPLLLKPRQNLLKLFLKQDGENYTSLFENLCKFLNSFNKRSPTLLQDISELLALEGMPLLVFKELYSALNNKSNLMFALIKDLASQSATLLHAIRFASHALLSYPESSELIEVLELLGSQKDFNSSLDLLEIDELRNTLRLANQARTAKFLSAEVEAKCRIRELQESLESFFSEPQQSLREALQLLRKAKGQKIPHEKFENYINQLVIEQLKSDRQNGKKLLEDLASSNYCSVNQLAEYLWKASDQKPLDFLFSSMTILKKLSFEKRMDFLEAIKALLPRDFPQIDYLHLKRSCVDTKASLTSFRTALIKDFLQAEAIAEAIEITARSHKQLKGHVKREIELIEALAPLTHHANFFVYAQKAGKASLEALSSLYKSPQKPAWILFSPQLEKLHKDQQLESKLQRFVEPHSNQTGSALLEILTELPSSDYQFPSEEVRNSFQTALQKCLLKTAATPPLFEKLVFALFGTEFAKKEMLKEISTKLFNLPIYFARSSSRFFAIAAAIVCKEDSLIPFFKNKLLSHLMGLGKKRTPHLERQAWIFLRQCSKPHESLNFKVSTLVLPLFEEMLYSKKIAPQRYSERLLTFSQIQGKSIELEALLCESVDVLELLRPGQVPHLPKFAAQLSLAAPSKEELSIALLEDISVCKLENWLSYGHQLLKTSITAEKTSEIILNLIESSAAFASLRQAAFQLYQELKKSGPLSAEVKARCYLALFEADKAGIKEEQVLFIQNGLPIYRDLMESFDELEKPLQEKLKQQALKQALMMDQLHPCQAFELRKELITKGCLEPTELGVAKTSAHQIISQLLLNKLSMDQTELEQFFKFLIENKLLTQQQIFNKLILALQVPKYDWNQSSLTDLHLQFAKSLFLAAPQLKENGLKELLRLIQSIKPLPLLFIDALFTTLVSELTTGSPSANILASLSDFFEKMHEMNQLRDLFTRVSANKQAFANSSTIGLKFTYNYLLSSISHKKQIKESLEFFVEAIGLTEKSDYDHVVDYLTKLWNDFINIDEGSSYSTVFIQMIEKFLERLSLETHAETACLAFSQRVYMALLFANRAIRRSPIQSVRLSKLCTLTHKMLTTSIVTEQPLREALTLISNVEASDATLLVELLEFGIEKKIWKQENFNIALQQIKRKKNTLFTNASLLERYCNLLASVVTTWQRGDEMQYVSSFLTSVFFLVQESEYMVMSEPLQTLLKCRRKLLEALKIAAAYLPAGTEEEQKGKQLLYSSSYLIIGKTIFTHAEKRASLKSEPDELFWQPRLASTFLIEMLSAEVLSEQCHILLKLLLPLFIKSKPKLLLMITKAFLEYPNISHEIKFELVVRYLDLFKEVVKVRGIHCFDIIDVLLAGISVHNLFNTNIDSFYLFTELIHLHIALSELKLANKEDKDMDTIILGKMVNLLGNIVIGVTNSNCKTSLAKAKSNGTADRIVRLHNSKPAPIPPYFLEEIRNETEAKTDEACYQLLSESNLSPYSINLSFFANRTLELCKQNGEETLIKASEGIVTLLNEHKIQ